MLRVRPTLVSTRLNFNYFRVRKERAKRAAIYRVSALIKTDARRSLRIRPGKSKPGRIPKIHRPPSLRAIAFRVSANKDSSVIGPIKFPRSNRYNRPVPAIHEFGATVIDYIRNRVKRYPERPYMIRTLERLNRKGLIPKEFSATIARNL